VIVQTFQVQELCIDGIVVSIAAFQVHGLIPSALPP
jgi:hypothetical protein